VTYGTPTWIWCVAVDGELYARAYNGPKSRWYQAAVRQGAGRIIAAGMTKEVTLQPVDGSINERPGLPSEVRRQSVPRADDQRARPLGDGQSRTDA
jgi:hypothetical protein